MVILRAGLAPICHLLRKLVKYPCFATANQNYTYTKVDKAVRPHGYHIIQGLPYG
jgi:hypothetical protein